MQFNPVVLFVGSLPAGASSQRYKKRGNFGVYLNIQTEERKHKRGKILFFCAFVLLSDNLQNPRQLQAVILYIRMMSVCCYNVTPVLKMAISLYPFFSLLTNSPLATRMI